MRQPCNERRVDFLLSALGAAVCGWMLFIFAFLLLCTTFFLVAEQVAEEGRPSMKTLKTLEVLAALMTGVAVVIVLLSQWGDTWAAAFGLLLVTPVVLFTMRKRPARGKWKTSRA